jgi:hypothetical protein
MILEGQDKSGQEVEEEGHQLLNVMLAQGGALPDDEAYLNGCSTVAAFKAGKYLEDVKTSQRGIKSTAMRVQ